MHNCGLSQKLYQCMGRRFEIVFAHELCVKICPNQNIYDIGTCVLVVGVGEWGTGEVNPKYRPCMGGVHAYIVLRVVRSGFIKN